MTPRTVKGLGGGLFILVFILLDQVSKIIVLKFFPELVVFNQGVSLGFFPSSWWIAINLFIIFILAILYGQQEEPFSIKRQGPLVLIISGGLANIVDRILRGKVIDFIELGSIPVFNLADVFICLGVAILIFNMIYNKPYVKKFTSDKKAPL